MATYIYAPKMQAGVPELLSALDAKRLTRFDGMRFTSKGVPLEFNEAEDAIICWGGHVPPIGKLPIFNSSLQFVNQLQLNCHLEKVPFKARMWQPAVMIRSNVSNLPGNEYASDPDYGNVVLQPDFPGYVQPFYTMKYEYRALVISGEVKAVTVKTATKKVHTLDYGVYNPDVYSHAYYRTEAFGWVEKPVKLAHVPTVTSIAQKFVTAAELDFAIVYLGCNEIDGYNSGYSNNIIRKVVTAPTLESEDAISAAVTMLTDWLKS